MKNTYQVEVACSKDCPNIVRAQIEDDMILDAEKCEEITEAVQTRGGDVYLTAEDLRRNPHVFTEEEAAEAERDGGYHLVIHVPDCAECGSDR